MPWKSQCFLPSENHSAASGAEGRWHSQALVYKVTVRLEFSSSHTNHLQSHLVQSVSVLWAEGSPSTESLSLIPVVWRRSACHFIQFTPILSASPWLGMKAHPHSWVLLRAGAQGDTWGRRQSLDSPSLCSCFCRFHQCRMDLNPHSGRAGNGFTRCPAVGNEALGVLI